MKTSSTSAFNIPGQILVFGSQSLYQMARQALDRLHYLVLNSETAQEALAALANPRVNLLIFRASGGEEDLALCLAFKRARKDPYLPVLLVADRQHQHLAETCHHHGANDILFAPVDAPNLIARAKAALKYGNAVRAYHEAIATRQKAIAEQTASLRETNERLSREIADKEQSEALLREKVTVLESANLGVAKLDAKGQVLEANAEHRRLFGEGASWLSTFEVSERQRVVAALQAARHRRERLEAGIKAGGQARFAELILQPVPQSAHASYCLFSLDISQRRESEARLRRKEDELRAAQKMESLGRLAGGIAHDFNNILTVIQGYGSMLRKATREDHPHYRKITAIEDATRRARDLTRQILNLSHRHLVSPAALNVNTILHEFESMLPRILGEDVLFMLTPATHDPIVLIDRSQLEQVVLNLCVNAREAMPKGGLLTIRTKLHPAQEAREGKEDIPLVGPCVELEVADSGCGMDAETIGKIFDPFFTMGKPGGTGLGLSTVYGIVKQYGGQITVTSTPGDGSTFRVFLPFEGKQPAVAPAQRADPIKCEGERTVLVVDDDPGVQVIVQEYLSELGYRTHSAADGPQALRWASDRETHLDLVVTDVVMPHMSGVELVKQLRLVRPRIKVLFMSGYAEDRLLQDSITKGEYLFIQKPFSQAELSEAVSRVLRAGEPGQESAVGFGGAASNGAHA